VTGGSNSMGYFPYLSTITWTDNDLMIYSDLSINTVATALLQIGQWYEISLTKYCSK